MSQRTDTRRQTIFHHPDQGVSIEFVKPGQIKFTVAAAKNWISPIHWHVLHDGCCRITCLQGNMRLTALTPYGGSGTYTGGAGSSVDIERGDHHVWHSDKPDRS
jgi:hypothetical protein